MPRITQSSPTNLPSTVQALLEQAQPCLLMGIGVPGSGKTTILKALATQLSLGYVCPDDIRAELLGNATDQSGNKEVWDEAYRRIQAVLRAQQSVVLDATNVKADDRMKGASVAREAGAKSVIGVHVFAPLKNVLRQNATRPRQVPEHAIHAMQARLKSEPPATCPSLDVLIEVYNG